MVQEALWCVASFLHAQVPTTAALCTIGRLLALVKVEVEAHAAIVVIQSNAALVLKFCRQYVCSPLALAFGFSTALCISHKVGFHEAAKCSAETAVAALSQMPLALEAASDEIQPRKISKRQHPSPMCHLLDGVLGHPYESL